MNRELCWHFIKTDIEEFSLVFCCLEFMHLINIRQVFSSCQVLCDQAVLTLTSETLNPFASIKDLCIL